MESVLFKQGQGLSVSESLLYFTLMVHLEVHNADGVSVLRVMPPAAPNRVSEAPYIRHGPLEALYDVR